jgi:flavin-dependent dehydrogenase
VRLRRSSEDVVVRTKVVVCSDGLSGTALRGWRRMRAQVAPNSRVGVSSSAGTTFVGPPPGTIRMSVARMGYVGQVVLEDDTLNVAAAVDPGQLRSAAGVSHVVDSIVRESGCSLITSSWGPWKGTPPLSRRRGRAANDRVFWVGDSASYVEPFTGEGMGWALLGSKLLAPIVEQAIDHWTPALSRRWENIYRSRIGKRQSLCRLLSRTLRSQMASRLVTLTLACLPNLAGMAARRTNRRISEA